MFLSHDNPSGGVMSDGVSTAMRLHCDTQPKMSAFRAYYFFALSASTRGITLAPSLFQLFVASHRF